MAKPKANLITAATTTLQVDPDSYEPSYLQNALAGVVDNPEAVKVDNGTITLDSSDIEAATVLLAEIGLEVLSQDSTSATPVTTATSVTAGSAPADNTPPGTDANHAVAPDSTPATPVVENGPTAGDDSDINEDDVYAHVEGLLVAAGSCLPVLVASAKGPAYLLIAGDEPAARIDLCDQDDPDAISAIFEKPEYINSVMASFAKNGIAQTLGLVKATVLTAKKVQPAVQPDLKAVKNLAIASFLDCLALAHSSAQKNHSDNPLKASAFQLFADARIADPIAATEQLFAAFPGYMEAVTARALKYMEMEPSALKAVKDTIDDLGVQIRASAPAQRTEHFHVLAAGSTPVTVPVGETVMASHVSGGVADSFRNKIAAGITPRIG
jgi:hypothetical protein